MKRFPCKQCGAKLEYDPGTTRLACGHCGFENPIPQSAEDIRELDFAEHLAKVGDAAETVAVTTIQCDSCAATFDKPAHTTALACPFCGIHRNNLKISFVGFIRAAIPFAIMQLLIASAYVYMLAMI